MINCMFKHFNHFTGRFNFATSTTERSAYRPGNFKAYDFQFFRMLFLIFFEKKSPFYFCVKKCSICINK